MSGTRRRIAAIAVIAATTATIGACTDDGGSKDAFCREVTELPPLDAAISDYAEADTTELGRRLTSTGESYDDLRDAAPQEIRASVDDVVDLVDAVLAAVRDHAEDPEVVADELRDAVIEHPAAADASARVVAYAERNCDVELDPMLEGEVPSTTTAPDAGDRTTTTAVG